MDIRSIIRGPIGSVNPDITAQFQRSTGNTVDAAGNQVPGYADAVPVQIQSQPLSAGQIRHTDFLNIQGTKRSVRMFGNTRGIVRPTQSGGDLLTFAITRDSPPMVWKVVEVPETWPTWSQVIVVLQTDPVTCQ